MRRRGRRQFVPVWNAKRGVYEGKLLEEHVLREIVERLWFQKRIKVWRINQPVGGKTPQNEPGLPDLWGWVPAGETVSGQALPLVIEVKRPGGVRRPAQERFIKEARETGCVAGFCESWADVIALLKEKGIVL